MRVHSLWSPDACARQIAQPPLDTAVDEEVGREESNMGPYYVQTLTPIPA